MAVARAFLDPYTYVGAQKVGPENFTSQKEPVIMLQILFHLVKESKL